MSLDADEPDPPGLGALRASGIAFDVVRTALPNSAEESAALQGLRLEQLLRTIVVRRRADDYLLVLVPGGRQIDWPKLRAHLGVSRLSLPDQDEAREATGYERGAITPLGSARPWPVIADITVGVPEVVAIGAGMRGVNAHVRPSDLIRLLEAQVADVTKPASKGGA